MSRTWHDIATRDLECIAQDATNLRLGAPKIMQFEEGFVSLSLYKYSRLGNTTRKSNNIPRTNIVKLGTTDSRPPSVPRIENPPPAPASKKQILPPLPPEPQKQSPIVTSLLKAWLSTARCRLARVKEEQKDIKRKEIDIVKL